MQNTCCAGQIFFIELVKENLIKIYVQNKHKKSDYLVFTQNAHNLKIGDFIVASINIDNQNNKISNAVKIMDLI